MMNTLNQIILRKPGKYNQIWSIILYSFWNVLTRSQLLVDIAIKQIKSEFGADVRLLLKAIAKAG